MEDFFIPIIASIVGALIGGFFTLIISRKKEKKEESLRLQNERKEIFKNRPEYKIVEYKNYIGRVGHGIKKETDLDVFMTPIHHIEINGRVDAIYDKKFFNNDEWCCVIYVLENVGKTDIAITHVLCNHKRTEVLMGTWERQ